MVLWGGNTSDNLAHAYDPVTQRWTKLPPPPLEARATFPAMAGSEGGVLMFGGLLDDGTKTASSKGAWYTPATQTWNPIVEPRPVARGGAAAVAIPGGVFVWGGTTATGRRTHALGDGAIFYAPSL